MERSEASRRCKQIVAGELDIPVEQLQDNKTFRSLVPDPMDFVDLVFKIEDEFDIQIPEDDAEKLDTVGKMIDYIQQKAK